MSSSLNSGLAGGNDANEFAFELDMHDIKCTSTSIATNHRVARLFMARCVDQVEERIEKYFGRLFKSDVFRSRAQASFNTILPVCANFSIRPKAVLISPSG